MPKIKFIILLTFVVGVSAMLFLLGLVLVNGLKYGFGDSLHLMIVALPLCGMIYFTLFFCAWVHYRLMIGILGMEPNEKQVGLVRLGSLVFVGLVELFILSSLTHMNSTFSLIILYIPPIALFSFLIQFLIVQILVLKKKS